MNTTVAERMPFASAMVVTLRPRQWAKNLFVLSPVIFSRHLFEPGTLLRALAAAALFSLIASAVYILNDLVDVRRDREHPVKRLRPIASGRLRASAASAMMVVLVTVSAGGAAFLDLQFAGVILGYFLLNAFYSLYLKEMVIIDVMTVAASFVLRIVAGAAAIRVPVSEWLLICTSLLALFLGFSKRRHELTLLESNASVHRAVLTEYSSYFLDQMISLVTASTLICYILYTVDDDTILKFGSKNLLYTVPFVLYGLFRYLYLVHQRRTGGDPTAEFLTDRPLLICVFLWAVSVVLAIYLQ